MDVYWIICSPLVLKLRRVDQLEASYENGKTEMKDRFLNMNFKGIFHTFNRCFFVLPVYCLSEGFKARLESF